MSENTDEPQGACLDYSVLPSDDDGDNASDWSEVDSDPDPGTEGDCDNKDVVKIFGIGSHIHSHGPVPAMKNAFSKKDNKKHGKKCTTEIEFGRQVVLSKFGKSMKDLLRNRDKFIELFQLFQPDFPDNLTADEVFICELIRLIFRDGLYVTPGDSWKYICNVFPKIISKICLIYPGMSETFLKEIENLCKHKIYNEALIQSKMSKRKKAKRNFRILLKKRVSPFFRFMSSLCNCKLLSLKFTIEFIDMLLEKKDEESCECLCLLLSSIWEKTEEYLEEEIKRQGQNPNVVNDFTPPVGYMEKSFETIKELALDRSLTLSEEVRSAMMNLVQLRDSTVIQVNSPKPVLETPAAFVQQINQLSTVSISPEKNRRERRKEKRLLKFGPGRNGSGTGTGALTLDPPNQLQPQMTKTENNSSPPTAQNEPEVDFFSYVRVFDHTKTNDVILDTNHRQGRGQDPGHFDVLKQDWVKDFRKSMKDMTKERRDFRKLFNQFRPTFPHELFTEGQNRTDFISEIINSIFREAIHIFGQFWRTTDNVYGKITQKLCEIAPPEVSKILHYQIERQCEEEVHKYIVRDAHCLKALEAKVNAQTQSGSKRSRRPPKPLRQEFKVTENTIDELNTRRFHCKRRNTGFLTFMASLFNSHVLGLKFTLDFIDNLLVKQTEESLECLCLLLSTIWEKIEEFGKTSLVGNGDRPDEFTLPVGYVDQLLAQMIALSFDQRIQLSEEVRSSMRDIVVEWNRGRAATTTSSQVEMDFPKRKPRRRRNRELRKEMFGGAKVGGTFTKKVKDKEAGCESNLDQRSPVNLSDEYSFPTLPSEPGSSRSSFSLFSHKDSMTRSRSGSRSNISSPITVTTTSTPLIPQPLMEMTFPKIQFVSGGVEFLCDLNRDEVKAGPSNAPPLPVLDKVGVEEPGMIAKTFIETLCELKEWNVEECSLIFIGALFIFQNEKTVSKGGRLIIAKALLEPHHSRLCARMVNMIGEHPDGKIFWKCVINQVQRKFQDTFSVDVDEDEEIEILEFQLTTVAEELRDSIISELDGRRYLRWKTKCGLVTFIGNLYMCHSLSPNIVRNCLLLMLDVETNESYECICTLLHITGQMLESLDNPKIRHLPPEIRKTPRRPYADAQFMDTVFQRLRTFSASPKCSEIFRMEILGLIGLRSNVWRWVLDGPVRFPLPEEKPKKNIRHGGKPGAKLPGQPDERIQYSFNEVQNFRPTEITPQKTPRSSKWSKKDKGRENQGELDLNLDKTSMLRSLLKIDDLVKSVVVTPDGVDGTAGVVTKPDGSPVKTKSSKSSRFQNKSVVDVSGNDDVKKTIGFLNKLTARNVEGVSKEFYKLFTDKDIDTAMEIIRTVIPLVFERAIDNPTLSPLYIQMVTLAGKSSESDADSRSLWFQQQFGENFENLCEKGIQKYYGGQESENIDLKNKTQYGKDGERKRGVGLITFMGDLFVQSLLCRKVIVNSLTKLVECAPSGSLDDSYELVCALLTPSVGAKLESELKEMKGVIMYENTGFISPHQSLDKTGQANMYYLDGIFSILKSVIDMDDIRVLTPRVKFAVMDLIELRENSWKPRDRNYERQRHLPGECIRNVIFKETDLKPSNATLKKQKRAKGNVKVTNDRTPEWMKERLNYNPNPLTSSKAESVNLHARTEEDGSRSVQAISNSNPPSSPGTESKRSLTSMDSESEIKSPEVQSPSVQSLNFRLSMLNHSPMKGYTKNLTSQPFTENLDEYKPKFVEKLDDHAFSAWLNTETDSSRSPSPEKTEEVEIRRENPTPSAEKMDKVEIEGEIPTPSAEETEKVEIKEKISTPSSGKTEKVEIKGEIPTPGAEKTGKVEIEGKNPTSMEDGGSKTKKGNRKMYDRNLLLSLMSSQQAQFIPECLKYLPCYIYYVATTLIDKNLKLTKKDKKRLRVANFDAIPSDSRNLDLGDYV